MNGKIIKGIAGFYYVFCDDEQVYECKAKGTFRKDGVKPLVGDNVTIDVLDSDKLLGNIVEIKPRSNEIIRPSVANVDQAMIVFAMADPMPNLNLLDRFLVMMEKAELDTIICFSKQDMVDGKRQQDLQKIYSACSNKVITISNTEKTGIDMVKECLKGKTTVLAGPSGVGKSSLLNSIFPKALSQTGEISAKIGRGKHTTRHSELFHIGHKTFLFDTPGFSSLKLPDIEKEELKYFYSEFIPFEGQCKFLGCSHINEPNCAVKEALLDGCICQSRYDNYIQMFEELDTISKNRNWRSVR